MDEPFCSPALLFDLDGTLIDSVYQHVLAWHEALQSMGLLLAVWRIHRRIGMSGGLLAQALGREIGQRVTHQQPEELQKHHAAAFLKYQNDIQPPPGAAELLVTLREAGVPWAIATSGRREAAAPALEKLGVLSTDPVITRQEVHRAKPDPDLFLAAAERLQVPVSRAMVVGDSVWDLLAARRAGCLGVGILSGGYGREKLQQVGAYRVYQDPADMLVHLDEIGIRRDEGGVPGMKPLPIRLPHGLAQLDRIEIRPKLGATSVSHALYPLRTHSCFSVYRTVREQIAPQPCYEWPGAPARLG